MKIIENAPKIIKIFLGGSAPQTPHNILTKFSFADLVNVFENQKIFLKRGRLLTWRVLLSKRMFTNLTAGRSKKKYHPISTNPKIGVRGGKLLRTHGEGICKNL